MDRGRVTEWVAGYERAWRAAGTGGLAALFTPDAVYQQAPYEEPVIGLPAIARMWDAEGTGRMRCSGCRATSSPWTAMWRWSGSRSATATRSGRSTATCGSSGSRTTAGACRSRNGRSGPASRWSAPPPPLGAATSSPVGPVARPGRRAGAGPTSTDRARQPIPGTGRAARRVAAGPPIPGSRGGNRARAAAGQVVADRSGAGLAAETLRGHPGTERGDRGEHVRTALRGGDRPDRPVREASCGPGAGSHLELAGHPRNDRADDEVEMRAEPPSAVAGHVLLSAPVGPLDGLRAGVIDSVVHASQQHRRDGSGLNGGLQDKGETARGLPVRQHATRQRPSRPGGTVNGHPARCTRGRRLQGLLVQRAGESPAAGRPAGAREPRQTSWSGIALGATRPPGWPPPRS